MGYEPDANRSTFIPVISILGQHAFRQAERHVRILDVISSIEADALDVFFRITISVGSVVCQPQSCLYEEPGERLAYGAGADTHKKQLAPAQLRNRRPSQYVIVQTKRTNAGIGQHSRSCHHEHVATHEPFDHAEPSIQVHWNSNRDLSQQSPGAIVRFPQWHFTDCQSTDAIRRCRLLGIRTYATHLGIGHMPADVE